MAEPLIVMDFDHRIRLPAHALVVGASMSGKTRLLLKILTHPKTSFVEPPKLVILFYAELQKQYLEAKETLAQQGIEMQLRRGHEVKLDELVHQPYQTLVVVDDAFEATASSSEISRIATNGRHKNVSIWLLWHALYSKHATSRIISQNMGLFFFLPSPRIESQLRTFGAQLGMQHRLVAAYKYCAENCDEESKTDFPHLLVDLTPNVPGLLRLRSHIHESVQYCYG
jgi:hypothetical protein